MIGAVLEFLFHLQGLSVPFVVAMGAHFAVGAAYALIQLRLVGPRLEQAGIEYANEWNERMTPHEYLRLGVNEQRFEKVLDAVPGLLVTLGILGTFIGLGIAIAEASRAMSEPAQAMEGLKGLLSTVSFKFQASAWGSCSRWCSPWRSRCPCTARSSAGSTRRRANSCRPTRR